MLSMHNKFVVHVPNTLAMAAGALLLLTQAWQATHPVEIPGTSSATEVVTSIADDTEEVAVILDLGLLLLSLGAK